MDNMQKYNNDLVSLFEKKEPFSLVRIGNTEGHFLDSYLKNVTPGPWKEWLFYNAGVYPVSDEYLKTIWVKINIESVISSDMVGFVDISGDVKQSTNFLNTYCKDKPLFFRDDIEFLNPVVALGFDNPWMKQLKGKKVLIVSSHKETIEFQWENIKNVWGDNLDIAAPFDLVGVVRSPFNPVCDSRQYENCDTWDDTLNAMYSLISSYDYDVLLVGAGAFSPALAAYAKEHGKIGITLCGFIQLFFGILGYRWASYSEHSDKQNWIYPLQVDLPENSKIMDSIEKSYW